MKENKETSISRTKIILEIINKVITKVRTNQHVDNSEVRNSELRYNDLYLTLWSNKSYGSSELMETIVKTIFVNHKLEINAENMTNVFNMLERQFKYIQKVASYDFSKLTGLERGFIIRNFTPTVAYHDYELEFFIDGKEIK